MSAQIAADEGVFGRGPTRFRRVTEGSRKAILAAFAANLGIAISKFVGFLLTNSAGLFAEAFHSLADTGNQGLLMLGGKRAGRKPTPEHPVRLRARALLLGVRRGPGAVLDGRAVRHRTRGSPSSVIRTRWRICRVAIVILLIAIALESFSLRTALTRRRARTRRRTSRGGGTSAASKAPELPVVLLEDVGAEIGLLMALSGVLSRPLHRRAALGRPRHRSPSALLLVRHRRRAGGGDEGLAPRRVGVGRRTSPRSTPRSPARRRCAASSTCAPSTSPPTNCWSRPRWSSTRS